MTSLIVPKTEEAIDHFKYRMAYNVIGPVIEKCIRANKGEDGLILTDYAELRDALAEALLAHMAEVEKRARLDEVWKYNGRINTQGFTTPQVLKLAEVRDRRLADLMDVTSSKEIIKGGGA